jgi:phosphoserine phosphatase
MQAHGRAGAYRAFLFRELPGVLFTRLGLRDRRAFQDGFMERAARLLAGLDQEGLARVAEWVVSTELWPKRRPEVLDELWAAQQQGRRVVLCSATYQPVLEAFARRMGEGVVALGTPLVMEGGVFSGRLEGPVRSGVHKAVQIREFLRGEALYAAYGDTLSDLALLELAEHPVAVYPEAALQAVARMRGWRVIG